MTSFSSRLHSDPRRHFRDSLLTKSRRHQTICLLGGRDKSCIPVTAMVFHMQTDLQRSNASEQPFFLIYTVPLMSSSHFTLWAWQAHCSEVKETCKCFITEQAFHLKCKRKMQNQTFCVLSSPQSENLRLAPPLRLSERCALSREGLSQLKCRAVLRWRAALGCYTVADAL